jgi:hypothetical protein
MRKEDSAISDTHKVIKTEAIHLPNGSYGVEMTFDDGTTEVAVAGLKATAEYFARAQLGKELPVGGDPLLL